MAERDVDFNITVTREQFYTIVTLMLHDACHDFDAGKTDKEFKKLFMKKGIAVKLARHRTTPKLGGAAGESKRAQKFKEGIVSDDSRRKREETRFYVRKNKREEELRKKRQMQDLGGQLRLELERGDESPVRDSLPVSPVRTPPGIPELQRAPEDEEYLEAQEPPTTEPSIEYLFEYYNLPNDLMEKSPSLSRIIDIIYQVEANRQDPTRSPAPENTTLNFDNYDIFIDSLFKILSNINNDEYENIVRIFIDFIIMTEDNNSFLKTIIGNNGGDLKLYAIFMTNIIESLIDVLTNNYTKYITDEMVSWIKYLLSPLIGLNYLTQINITSNIIFGATTDINSKNDFYLIIFRKHFTKLIEIYDEIDRVIKEIDSLKQTPEGITSIRDISNIVLQRIGLTQEKLDQLFQQIKIDINMQLLEDYGVSGQALIPREWKREVELSDNVTDDVKGYFTFLREKLEVHDSYIKEVESVINRNWRAWNLELDLSTSDNLLALAERMINVEGLLHNDPEQLYLAEKMASLEIDPISPGPGEKPLLIFIRDTFKRQRLDPNDRESYEIVLQLAAEQQQQAEQQQAEQQEWIVEEYDGELGGGGLSNRVILQIGGNPTMQEIYSNGWIIFNNIKRFHVIYNSHPFYNGRGDIASNILDDNNDIRTGDPTMDALPADEDERRNIETIRLILSIVLPEVEGTTVWGNPETYDKESIRNEIVTKIGYIRDNIKSINTIIRILKSFIYRQSYNGIKSSEKVIFIDPSTNSPEATIPLLYKDMGYLYLDHLIELIIVKNIINDPTHGNRNYGEVSRIKELRSNLGPSFSDGHIPPKPSYIHNSIDIVYYDKEMSAPAGRGGRITAGGQIGIISEFVETIETQPTGEQRDAADITINDSVTLDQLIIERKNEIERLIGNYENYLINAKYLLTFLEDQSQHFSTKFKFTAHDKLNRKDILTLLIKHYREKMFGTGEGPFTVDGTWVNSLFPIQNEINRIFKHPGITRQNGDALDRQLWRDCIASSNNPLNTLVFLDGMCNTGCINNAIPNDARKFLVAEAVPRKIKKLCLTAAVDPMGSFGDCAYRDQDEIKKSLDTPKSIAVLIKTEGEVDLLRICLTVTPKNNITMNGSIELKIKGEQVINTTIDENKFNNKQPLSISNTISHLEKILNKDDAFSDESDGHMRLNTDPTEGIQTVFVRKFLGDFLQAIEAICNNYIYLGGDKPAAIMYYYLKSLVSTDSNGGFTSMGEEGPITYDIDGLGELSNEENACPGMGGGGLRRLKDKKRRTNRRKTNKKRRTNRRKTNRKRRTNKKRRTNNRRRSNSNRRRRTNNRRRRSIRKRK